MTRLTAGAALCIAGLTLSGCGVFGDNGYFRDRGDDYQLANSLPPLRLPEGVEAKNQEELYEVPQVGSAELERGDFEVPRPQALAVNAGLERVKIQKLGNRRWVLVSQPPEEVWPQLHYFLRTSGLQLERSDATAGVMETTWLQFKDSPETKDKYRLRVESGVQPDTTEIHVRHLSAPAEMPASAEVSWPEMSTSPEREGWMIDEMSTALAADVTGAAASLVAQAIGGGSVKVQLKEPAGREPYITMALSRDRAWATVAHAVNAGAYRMHEEDAEAGILYVTYDEKRELAEDEEGGWFSWGGKKQDDLAEEAEQVTMQQIIANIEVKEGVEPVLFANLQGAGSATGADIPGYLVVVRSTPDQVEVRIRNTKGLPLSRAKASELLMAIQQNLI